MVDFVDAPATSDPLLLRRLMGLPPLVAPGLVMGREIPVAPAAVAATPTPTPAASPTPYLRTPELRPATVTPAPTGGTVSAPVATGTGSTVRQAGLPALRPGSLTPPDPNDPRYQVHGGKKVLLGTLGALAGLGGHLDVAASLNPYERALTTYKRNVEAEKTNLALADTQSQIEERRAQAARAEGAANRPESIDQELAKATMDAIHSGADPTMDPKVKSLIAVRNEAADKAGGPKVKDVKADDQGNAIAVMEDGTTKPLGYKETAKPETAEEDQAKYMDIQTRVQTDPKSVTPAEMAWAKSFEKMRTLGAAAAATNKDTTRSDKSYEFNSKQLETIRTPVNAAAGRMSNLLTSIGQSTPQADALVAPELLSIMAGGQGSGLRMNEAEISRIVGGRSKWESLKAAANKWSTDPKTANSITPEQRTQVKALADAVNQKLQSKLAILEQAEGDLVAADDPKEHRRILADARKKLDAIDAGQKAGLSADEATDYLRRAGGDKNKARDLARQDGRTF